MTGKCTHIILFAVAMCTTLLLSSCSTTKLSTVIAQYENGEYYAASQSFKKLYKKQDTKTEQNTKAEIAWYLANCYDKLMIWPQAESYFLNAQRYGYPDSTLQVRLDQVRQKQGKMKDRNQKSGRYQVRKFAVVNSRKAEFSPAIWGEDADELYYTTSNDKVNGSTNSTITGTKYHDIWVTRKDEKGNWQKPQSAGDGINSLNDEGTPCFSPDGSTMYYTVSSGIESGESFLPVIYYSKRTDASWGKGSKLEISRDTTFTYAHPAVSPDGKYIYYSSNAYGGVGGFDIWRAPLEGDRVGIPENLGDVINSKGDEMFPTFAPDGNLYYSSNGKDGFGGLDIYSARLDEWGVWHIEHLGDPINSHADDFGMTFISKTSNQQEGWFSSNRGSAKGYDNIYSFVLPSINVRITGCVYDSDGEPIPEAIVRVVGRNGMNFKSVTKPDGTYEVNIDRSTEYVVMSGKKGYLNRKAQFTSDEEEEDADYEVDFILPSAEIPVLVNNVFFDYNQATIQEESFESLNDLASILKENPLTRIELSSHTDRIGSSQFNLNLSKRRAESVCQYLIGQGIDSGRLVPIGYGKDMPKTVDQRIAEQYGFEVGQVLDEEYIDTLDEEQKKYADQINRRTEFKVIP